MRTSALNTPTEARKFVFFSNFKKSKRVKEYNGVNEDILVSNFWKRSHRLTLIL